MIMATKDKNTFSVYEDSIKNTAPQQDVTISEIYDYVISEDAKASTKELRTIADKDKARVFKSKNFGYATFSGSFTERKEEALKSYSNLICIDIDDTKDPLTRASSKSHTCAGGEGRKVQYKQGGSDPGLGCALKFCFDLIERERLLGITDTPLNMVALGIFIPLFSLLAGAEFRVWPF